ncbi:MAG TPA: PAS domain S-box protein [Kineosporiaceae bacterium]|nr:PAS domain S-box protein [Kineosporiaceae bacterium]
MHSADTALLLRLEHSVSDLLADVANVADVPGEGWEQRRHGDAMFEPLLRTIGEALGWPVGIAWCAPSPAGLAVDTVLHCAGSWCDDAFDGSGFLTGNKSLTFGRGVGLPGNVWRTGEPAWIRDLREYTPFPRAALAEQAGLVAAFSFPVTSRDGLEGILEFFTTDVVEPRAPLVSTAVSLGRRIGDAMRRHRVDEASRRSEARLRAVLDAALDCVVIADSEGMVIEFNPAACRTFGYLRAQAVGSELAELIIPPSLREQHRLGVDRYLNTERPHILDQRVEITGMRADGSEFPVELTITRVAFGGRPVFTGYLRDLTDRRHTELELSASRRRVAEAAVVERQRLERDLHDGAQQRLVWLGTTLARTRTALPDEPARASALLDEAIDSLEETAAELRNLARGIHPGSLTRYGLSAALADMARRSPLELRWDETMTERFSAAVEAAAYFVISEALTNVARHAGTAQARVDLEVVNPDDGRPACLVVTVTDTGRGGAGTTGGTGLRGLADRVALLDGSLQVDSPVGNGTIVRARIPLPS